MTDRAALCARLVDPASAGNERWSDEALALARRERVHLIAAAAGLAPALAGDLRDAAALDALRAPEARRVFDALAAAGAPAIAIKGTALAHTHYARPELRPRIDTDLLIAAATRAAAERAFIDLGYVRAIETSGELCAQQCHYTRVDTHGVRHALDVHWRVSNVLAFADVLTFDEIVRDAVALPPLGPHAFGPSAVHSLLIACIHRTAHHYDSDHLIWLYDIYLLTRSLSEAERSTLVALASDRAVCAVCAAGIRRAAKTFGTGAPLAARLEKAAVGTEPTAAFLRNDMRLVDILAADLYALDGWPARLRLLREHAFPARAYMQARYGTHRPLSLPWLYLRRIVRGAPKWFGAGGT